MKNKREKKKKGSGKIKKVMEDYQQEEYGPIPRGKLLEAVEKPGKRVQACAGQRNIYTVPLSKWERKFICAFITSNGKTSYLRKKFGFKSSMGVYRVLKNKRIRDGIEDSFKNAGLSLSVVFGTIHEILTKRGDEKTDSNRLKAIEMLSKMRGWNAPEKKEINQKVMTYNRTDLNMLVKGLSKNFNEYEDEKRKIEKIIELKETG